MKKFSILSLLTIAACGGPDVLDGSDAMTIGFQTHALQCEVPGMSARLQVSGVEGVCLLSVNANRTVSGTCNGVPAGEIRDFRLVYYFAIGQTEIDLATVTARLDLRGETREEVRVEFPADRVTTDFDDDDDGRTNITEFCMGTNPRVRD